MLHCGRPRHKRCDYPNSVGEHYYSWFPVRGTFCHPLHIGSLTVLFVCYGICGKLTELLARDARKDFLLSTTLSRCHLYSPSSKHKSQEVTLSKFSSLYDGLVETLAQLCVCLTNIFSHSMFHQKRIVTRNLHGE